jgi:hypothetical protein
MIRTPIGNPKAPRYMFVLLGARVRSVRLMVRALPVIGEAGKQADPPGYPSAGDDLWAVCTVGRKYAETAGAVRQSSRIPPAAWRRIPDLASWAASSRAAQASLNPADGSGTGVRPGGEGLQYQREHPVGWVASSILSAILLALRAPIAGRYHFASMRVMLPCRKDTILNMNKKRQGRKTLPLVFEIRSPR